MPGLLSTLGLPPRAAGSRTAARPDPSVDAEISPAALADWRTERQAVVTRLRGLAARANKSTHVAAQQAFIEIQSLVKQLARDPLTLRQVNELERWLSQDDVVGDIDDLAVKIRAPLLAALGTARAGIPR